MSYFSECGQKTIQVEQVNHRKTNNCRHVWLPREPERTFLGFCLDANTFCRCKYCDEVLIVSNA